MLKDNRDTSAYNLALLINLLIIILIIPVFEQSHIALVMFEIFATTFLLLMIFVIQSNRKKLLAAAVISIVFKWLPELFHSNVLEAVAQVYTVVLVIFIVSMLIIQVAKSKKVTSTVILESINGYLLLGLVGAIFIRFIEMTHFGAFSFHTSGSIQLPDTIYFSFVTMTTLGYGDILPITAMAKSVTIFLSVAGQIYLTILIAMLVGKYLSHNPPLD